MNSSNSLFNFIIALTLLKTTFSVPTQKPYYEVVCTGNVASIVSVLLPNTGKVIMIERALTSGGFKGTTHAQEFDIQSSTVRPLNLPGDYFCSAGFISPEPSARFFNLGGNSGNLRTVLNYSPCGTPGKFGKCDIHDLSRVYSMDEPRWYPTGVPLPTGDFLFFGGTEFAIGLPDGSIPKQITTAEFVPRRFKNPISVPFLVDNADGVLYPIAHLLENGNIFMMANDQSAIINVNDLKTIKKLPANVGHRTYPSGAGNALLPLRPSNGYQSEIIICGGSAFPFSSTAPARNDCTRIKPLSQNPVWKAETMPSPRQLLEMVLLPDGTIFLTNGAADGTSGFGTYSKPVLDGWIYSPDAEIGKRFTVAGTTNISRFYHAEALLLEDGRVLISGSTPNINSNIPDTPFPDEKRIEIYTPSYLLSGLDRPVVSNFNDKKWGYSERIEIDVTVPSGKKSEVKAMLFTNGFVSHNLHMGQRMVELVVQLTSDKKRFILNAPPNAKIAPPGWYMVFIMDGPTPSIATWIQLGGDPANMANWPVKSQSNTCNLAVSAISQRFDCGDPATTEATCIANGCCWAPVTNGLQGPSCFQTPENTPTSIKCEANLAVPMREDCGLTTPDECAAGGCCWGPLDNGVAGPSCYKKTTNYAPRCNLNLSVEAREDCGMEVGKDSNSCLKGNCCWSPLTVPGPWCFKPSIN